jgi:hypothetical protein
MQEEPRPPPVRIDSFPMDDKTMSTCQDPDGITKL